MQVSLSFLSNSLPSSCSDTITYNIDKNINETLTLFIVEENLENEIRKMEDERDQSRYDQISKIALSYSLQLLYFKFIYFNINRLIII